MKCIGCAVKCKSYKTYIGYIVQFCLHGMSIFKRLGELSLFKEYTFGILNIQHLLNFYITKNDIVFMYII